MLSYLKQNLYNPTSVIVLYVLYDPTSVTYHRQSRRTAAPPTTTMSYTVYRYVADHQSGCRVNIYQFVQHNVQPTQQFITALHYISNVLEQQM